MILAPPSEHAESGRTARVTAMTAMKDTAGRFSRRVWRLRPGPLGWRRGACCLGLFMAGA